MVKIAITDLATQDVYCSNCKKADVSAWIALILMVEMVPHATSAAAPKVTLTVSPFSGHSHPVDSTGGPTLEMCLKGPICTQPVAVYRRIKR